MELHDMLHGAFAPLPPLPTFKIGPGPYYKDMSYYDPATDTVWLLWSEYGKRRTVFHELGHVFDRKLMDAESRRQAAAIIGHPGLRWFWGNWNPLRHYKQPNEENFADAYATACLGGRVKPGFRLFLREVARGQ